MFVRRVNGSSMSPGLSAGAIVVAFHRSNVRLGDVVIAQQQGKEVIKRVEKIDAGSYYLVGDNRHESSDSRHFGPVKKRAILGVMKFSLPVARVAPRIRHRFSPILGMVAAALLTTFALVHLFRIDTFLPILNNVLPGGLVIGVLIVTAEVFAVPVMLRMHLSPLAGMLGVFLAVVVPLVWLLISIWMIGSNISTAQFGEFKDTPSSLTLIALNSIWLALNVATAWLLGYGTAPRLRKKP